VKLVIRWFDYLWWSALMKICMCMEEINCCSIKETSTLISRFCANHNSDIDTRWKNMSADALAL